MSKQVIMQNLLELAVLLISGYFLYKYQTRKPNLVSYMTNVSIFPLPGPPPVQALGSRAVFVFQAL